LINFVHEIFVQKYFPGIPRQDAWSAAYYYICSLTQAPLVVTQKIPVSTLPKVESRPEFAPDHESGLRSDRGPAEYIL
jgi:hypothetical protein